MDKRISNLGEIVSAMTVTLESGKAKGKRCVLVHAGEVEALFSCDNALDVVYLRYRGTNVSFLSRNGFNDDRRAFGSRFEGGFIYTCGLDSFSTCRGGEYELHGSLHKIPCDSVSYKCDCDGVTLEGVVSDTALFGQHLVLKRVYRITPLGIELQDTLENRAYRDTDYVFLYHINFGYPFLSESLALDFHGGVAEGTNPYSAEHVQLADFIGEPIDCADEDCFYRVMKEGRVTLTNSTLGFGACLEYDMERLPELIEWRSMASGDYALGIEPATTRFNPFKMSKIKAQESVTNKVKLSFFNA